MNQTQTTTENNVLVITRIFDAPRHIVWQAWTEPEHIVQWWGPKGFTAPHASVQLELGGKYLFCMQAPDGTNYWSTGIFSQIVEPDRLQFTDSFSDEHGKIVPATYYGMSEDYPLEMLVTISFEEVDGKTKMTLEHKGLPKGDTEMCGQGWNQSFDKLEKSIH